LLDDGSVYAWGGSLYKKTAEEKKPVALTQQKSSDNTAPSQANPDNKNEPKLVKTLLDQGATII